MTIQNAASKVSEKQVQEYRGQVLEWYDLTRRDLPWRAKPGIKPDPYHVWLSEIMLQQTTVGAVIPYYSKFLEKWPEIHDLAAAEPAEVMREWAGLGYYARARNLHACAQTVSSQHSGQFPQDQQALQKLPGIGEYTSAAITTIAFGRPAVVMDGNIERVMARFFAEEAPLPKSKPRLKALTAQFFESGQGRYGDLAQALMDLGATVCIGGGAPRCHQCPLIRGCEGYARGIAADLPKKEKKPKIPKKYGHVFWISDERGQVLVHQRPPSGLLGGMVGLPTTAWTMRKSEINEAVPEGLELSEKAPLKSKVRHVFTHFELTLFLHSARLPNQLAPVNYQWITTDQIEIQGFPSLFKKAVAIFQKS
jgi:A/G-specific adenine glycosylase